MKTDFINTIINIQKAVKAAYLPTMQFYNDMAKTLAPMRDLQETINSTVYPAYKLQQTMQLLGTQQLESYSKIAQSYQSILDSVAEKMESLQSTFTFKMETIKKANEAAQSIYNAAENVLGPTSHMQKFIDNAREQARRINDPSIFNEFAPKIKDFLNQISTHSIQMDMPSAITVSGQTVTYDELNQTIQSIANDNGTSGEVFFEGMLSAAKKAKKPLQIIIFYLLLPVVLNIFANLITPDVNKFLKPKSRNNQVIKEIKRTAGSHFDAETLKSYRFVTASTLNVREGPSRNSKKIDEVYLGKVVYVIQKKKKSWTLIQYKDEDSDHIYEGWVYTRYIKKFRR